MQISRRRLFVGATSGVLFGSGCLSRVPFGGESGFRLGEFWIVNGRDTDQSISIRLKHGSDSSLDRDVEIPAGKTIELDRTWPTAPVEYTLAYEQSGNEEQSLELTADDDESVDEDCMFLQIFISQHVDVPGVSLSPAADHPWDPGC